MSNVMVNHPEIELVPRIGLKPNAKNARTHSEKQINQIASSIRSFGFVVPIVIDDDSRIVAGNARFEAARLLKLDEVPVIRVRFLTDEDRRAFALAENRLAELAGWDDDLLLQELNALFDSGYNIEITGFSTADLDLSIPDDPPDEPEHVELPDPERDAVSRLGDLWLIGPHRLYCGDAQRRAGLLEQGGTAQRKTRQVRYSIHALRHAAASLWIEQGLSAKRVQSWIGHGSVQVTLGTYGHLFVQPERDAAAVSAVEAEILRSSAAGVYRLG